MLNNKFYLLVHTKKRLYKYISCCEVFRKIVKKNGRKRGEKGRTQKTTFILTCYVSFELHRTPYL